MKLFNSTKHEVYKNLAEGIVNNILDRKDQAIKIDEEHGKKPFEEGYASMSYYNFFAKYTCYDIDIISKYKKDIPIVLEFVADNLLKNSFIQTSYRIYSKVSPKKASILEKLMPEGTFENISDRDEKYSIDKKLDEIMSTYEKSQNPEIPFIPPLFM